VRLVLAFLLIFIPSPAQADECIPEPASEWAPAGWACPPVYGEGIASTWPGPGAARNDCTWPFIDCETVTVTSSDTGLSISVTPVTWCHCWTRVQGPSGETDRIIDLDPSQVRALGLDPSRGLWRVSVHAGEPREAARTPNPEPVGSSPTAGAMLPDTSMRTP
jgi:hypothetical protein